MAHLARANPFNAPHLLLVQDGLTGPRSNPAGPPGPPRRSRNLAAAAVEGELRAPRMRSLAPLVVHSAFVARRTEKDAAGLLHYGTVPGCLP